jgi:hypothetical protein
MTQLDALLGRVQSDGVELELGAGLNFKSPLSAVPNPATLMIDVGWPAAPTPVQSYTVAALPSASVYSGQIIRVSNGFNGRPCLAMSDGTSWWVIAHEMGKVAASVPSTTIAAGVITVVNPVDVAVDTEAAAASDDLDTINGTVAGQIIIIRAVDSARTIVLKDGTGNMKLAGDITLDNHEDRAVLRSNGTTLFLLSFSNNGA